MKSIILYAAAGFALYVCIMFAIVNWQLAKIRRMPQTIMDFVFGYEKMVQKALLKEKRKASKK